MNAVRSVSGSFCAFAHLLTASHNPELTRQPHCCFRGGPPSPADCRFGIVESRHRFSPGGGSLLSLISPSPSAPARSRQREIKTLSGEAPTFAPCTGLNGACNQALRDDRKAFRAKY